MAAGLAVATALAGGAVTRGARRLMPYVNRISGVLLLLVGLYVGAVLLTRRGVIRSR